MVPKHSKETAKLAVHALEEKKAKDIRIIDISDVTVLADYFIIASGNNRNQVQAMADEVEEALYKAGMEPNSRRIPDCKLDSSGLSGYYYSYF